LCCLGYWCWHPRRNLLRLKCPRFPERFPVPLFGIGSKFSYSARKIGLSRLFGCLLKNSESMNYSNFSLSCLEEITMPLPVSAKKIARKLFAFLLSIRRRFLMPSRSPSILQYLRQFVCFPKCRPAAISLISCGFLMCLGPRKSENPSISLGVASSARSVSCARWRQVRKWRNHRRVRVCGRNGSRRRQRSAAKQS